MLNVSGELTAADREQLAARGIDLAEAERQLRLLREPPHPPRLLRPCTVGDGIRRLDEREQETMRATWRSWTSSGDAVKLVPASGAASRMFGTLLPLLEEEPFPTPASSRGAPPRAMRPRATSTASGASCPAFRSSTSWPPSAPRAARRSRS